MIIATSKYTKPVTIHVERSPIDSSLLKYCTVREINNLLKNKSKLKCIDLNQYETRLGSRISPTIRKIKHSQCEKYDQKAPHHTQIDLLLQRYVEVINFRHNIDDARIKTEINQPLVFRVISQINNIERRDFGYFQLNV